jgi:hypothetical protein
MRSRLLKLGGAALLALGVAALAAGAVGRSAAPAAPPQPASVPFPSEARLLAEVDHVPPHVQTWYYFGLDGINENVPADVMARYADFIEDGDHGEFAARYKRAGGKRTAAYDDPVYIPYCSPPFKPPAGPCKQEFSTYIKDESGFFHGPDGARIHKYVEADKMYYEVVNPASPAARRAWREFTAVVKRRAPAIDFIYSDDSGGSLHFGDMSPKSSIFWEFNEAGVEVTNDDVFREAFVTYLSQSAMPLILNGGAPDNIPAYGGVYIALPFVYGNSHEGCFRDDAGAKSIEQGWLNEHQGLLSNTHMKKWGLCYMDGRPTNASRLYALASWWLSYDPQYSVAAPIQPAVKSSLLPEFNIVPRFPSRTIVANIAELRDAGGAFVREFGGCYEERIFVGRCATVVNPTNGPVAVPRLSMAYRRMLQLRGADMLAGGVTAWVPGRPPAALAPKTAVVLLQ